MKIIFHSWMPLEGKGNVESAVAMKMRGEKREREWEREGSSRRKQMKNALTIFADVHSPA
jgi:hypothetical protein